MEHEFNENKANTTASNARTEEYEKGQLDHFFTLFDYLRAEIENAPSNFMSRGKGMIDVEVCMDMLNDMYKTLPVAVRGASKVYQEQENILANARKEEARILNSAEVRARNQLDNANVRADNIIATAEEQAQRTIANAEARAERMIEEAREQVEEMVSETEIMRRATDDARTIVNQAMAEASDKRLAAAGYAEDIMEELDKLLLEMSDRVRARRSNI
ncbi:MAG: ATP synthase F0 subunit B [Clostridiales bacterium]|nr:ATP synthase F0 subunit B [Clostridiales bacterium]